MTAVAAERVARRTYARRRLVAPGWPVYFFFASIPFAWFLGLANLALPAYGVLLFFGLLVRGGVRFPARFGLWLLFLVWVALSALELDSSDRAFAYAYRASLYFTATALFVYIFTSSQRNLPTRSVVKALTFYWAAVVIGGFLGLAFPSVSLPSFAQHVLAPLLPGDIASVGFFQDITTPGFADVQRILGFPVGRPKTFFSYTNEWGSTLVLLIPFAILAMRMVGGLWRRIIGALLVLSLVPLVFSLNRGAWVALVVLIAYVSLRFAMQGNLRALGRVTLAVALSGLVIFATPLAGLIDSRLHHGHSNQGRETRDVAALQLVEKSPLFGYGAPQPAATNPSGPSVGTHGQLFLLLVSHGVPGLVLFLGWFLYSLIRTGTGGSSVRFWCHVAILVFIVQMPFYELTAFQLMVVAAAMGLAWRDVLGSPALSSDGRGLAQAVPGIEQAPIPAGGRRAAVGAGPYFDPRRQRPRRTPRRTRPQRGAPEPAHGPTTDLHRLDLSALARGGALSLAGGLAYGLFGFLLVLVISNGLGATGAGVFFEAVALFVIITRVAQAGADVGVIRALSRSLALGRSEEIRPTLAVAFAPVAFVSAGLAGALYLFAPAISRLVVNGTPPESLVSYIRLWAPFLVVAALSAVILAAARGLGSLLPFVSIENIGKPAVQPLLALTVISLGLGTTAVALSWVIPVAIGFAAAAWWLAVLVDRLAPARGTPVSQRSAALAKEFWRFASPRAVAAFFQAIAAWVDILLVGALASAKAAGIYAAASRLPLMGVLFLRALILVLGPQISSLLARDLRDRAQVVYQVSTWWLTALSWPFYILLAVFAPLALRVFGQEFVPGENALLVLALAMLVSMACGPVSVVLLMGGKSSWNLLNTIFAASLGVGLNFVLIPRYGVVGAAIAAAATVLANNLIPLAQVWGYLRLHPLGPGFLMVAGSALLTYGVVGVLGRLLLGATPVGLVVSGALATLGYVALLRRSRDTLKFHVIRDVVRSRGRAGTTDLGAAGTVSS